MISYQCFIVITSISYTLRDHSFPKIYTCHVAQNTPQLHTEFEMPLHYITLHYIRNYLKWPK